MTVPANYGTEYSGFNGKHLEYFDPSCIKYMMELYLSTLLCVQDAFIIAYQ